jgi:integrase
MRVEPHHTADLLAGAIPASVHVVLVWAGAGYHTAEALRPPPYSPELNPVGRLWRHLRDHHWSNRVASLAVADVVTRRDKAVISVLIYTAVRVGAVARLRLCDLRHDGDQWTLRFADRSAHSRYNGIRPATTRCCLLTRSPPEAVDGIVNDAGDESAVGTF